ncbi:hypothetical protein E2I00_005737 [Balaenoptera physalus]|uniref:Uncharacterized protein n=1 Tax=Balaenoptera physalus TaxID=9770 RepID=A0A6A1QBD8_BALPH|nr:hypothetical protein E2I00_005737 [Balaenoptera physalus]
MGATKNTKQESGLEPTFRFPSPISIFLVCYPTQGTDLDFAECGEEHEVDEIQEIKEQRKGCFCSQRGEIENKKTVERADLKSVNIRDEKVTCPSSQSQDVLRLILKPTSMDSLKASENKVTEKETTVPCRQPEENRQISKITSEGAKSELHKTRVIGSRFFEARIITFALSFALPKCLLKKVPGTDAIDTLRPLRSSCRCRCQCPLSNSDAALFVEIKGSVFKKFEKNNLFQMSNSGMYNQILLAALCSIIL